MQSYQLTTGRQRRHRDTFIKGAKVHYRCKNLELGRVNSSLRNSDAPILRFSTEIMARIFMYSQLVSRKGAQNIDLYSDWCWITITHVCQNWRNIAIGAQELWTYIDTTKHANIEQVAVYLERSRTSHLTVLFDWDDAGCGCTFECLYLALRHIHRIRELHIWNLERCPHYLIPYLCNPAPVLEIFSFHISSEEGIDIRQFFTRAPRLRQLFIHAKVISWCDVPMMRNLTYLDLDNGTLYVQSILSVASQNPNNDLLRITSLPNGDHNDQPRIRVRLPFLKYLYIPDASWSALSRLFKGVEFPALAGWNIFCKDFPIKSLPAIDSKSIIPRVLTLSSSNRGGRSCRSLEIALCKKYVKITADIDNAVEDRLLLRRSFNIQWSTFGEISRGEQITYSDCFEVICAIVEGSSLCSAISLTILLETNATGPDDMPQREYLGAKHWILLLKLLPQLYDLTIKHVTNLDTAEVVRGQSHYGIITALGKIFNEFTRERLFHGYVVCPKLNELHLCGLDLVNCDITEDILTTLMSRNLRKAWLNSLWITDVHEWTYKNLRLLNQNEVIDYVGVVDTRGEIIGLDDYTDEGKDDRRCFVGR